MAVRPLPVTAVLRLLFVGTLVYPPNEEAVCYLARRVLPALRRSRRSYRLTIVGRYASSSLRDLLQSVEQIGLMEDADDLAGLYNAAGVVLVPVRAGGGSKLKTLEAFAYKRPLVATSHGARGFGAVAGKHYLRAETPAEFAQAIARLGRDRALAERLARTGWELYQNAFGPPP